MGHGPRLLTVLAAGVVIALALSSMAHGRASPRIVAGSEGDIAATPWIVALLESGEAASDSQFCGGAVIAPQAVVTAAHCVEDATAADIDVLAGQTRLSGSGGERIEVAALRIHPDYDPETADNDVAVLLLSTPTAAPAIAVAGAGEAGLANAPGQVLIEGWGHVRTGGPASDVLLRGTQAIRANWRCERSWRGLFDQQSQFCSVGANDGRPDTCQGDSGGPVVATGADNVPRLVGVVSFGGECGVAEPPGVYTRLSFFAGWVAQQVPGAPAPDPTPTPEPSSQRDKLRLKFTRVECGLTCRVEVRLSGDGAIAVTSVLIRGVGRRSGRRFDRTVAARRVGARSWRGQINLPFGKNRTVATAIDRDGKRVGNKPKQTVIIVPAAKA